MASQVVRTPPPAEVLRLRPHLWGPVGEAVASGPDGEIRVFGGIPGEELLAEVTRRGREGTTARAVEVLSASSDRVVPPCPLFGACTGCQWQHVSYTRQLELKREIVVDALRRAGGFESPPVSTTLPSPEQLGYRNHARFTVGRRWGELGFVNRDSRRFVPVYHCLLMHPRIDEALGKLQRKSSETSQLSIRVGANTGDLLVQPALKNPEIPLESGQTHLRESLNGAMFRVASSSFFQVNTPQAERMMDLVKSELGLPADGLLVDAYAGVGTFAVLLAPHVTKVIAIEDSESAVRDAAVNAAGLNNVEFVMGRTEDILADMKETPVALVLDPPRSGCHPKALEAVARLSPARVVYVSCEPETLARDLGILCRGQYRLESVIPIDMFPQTHRVECVATLSLGTDAYAASRSSHLTGRPVSTEIILASASPRRRELLGGLGVDFRVVAPDIDEEALPGEAPEDTPCRLALAKARCVAGGVSEGLVIGADSLVVLDGRAYGKPSDPLEARQMLGTLRGKEHCVVTGVAIVDADGGDEWTGAMISRVAMREYTEDELDAYLASRAPMDKAGAYGIQDRVFRPAARVEGCYTNVVGLPLCLLAELLERAGYDIGSLGDIAVPDECRECPLKKRS